GGDETRDNTKFDFPRVFTHDKKQFLLDVTVLSVDVFVTLLQFTQLMKQFTQDVTVLSAEVSVTHLLLMASILEKQFTQDVTVLTVEVSVTHLLLMGTIREGMVPENVMAIVSYMSCYNIPPSTCGEIWTCKRQSHNEILVKPVLVFVEGERVVQISLMFLLLERYGAEFSCTLFLLSKVRPSPGQSLPYFLRLSTRTECLLYYSISSNELCSCSAKFGPEPAILPPALCDNIMFDILFYK
ncbi:hypothetical protein J6590_106565, partial [Homalodisca vitripennis]